jgi:hypothetical protein
VPEKKRAYVLKEKFGLTAEAYGEMLAAQGGACAICRGPAGGRWDTLCVDHDHNTGAVRGLLCLRCNRAIGLLRDDPALATAVSSYLKRRSGKK